MYLQFFSGVGFCAIGTVGVHSACATHPICCVITGSVITHRGFSILGHNAISYIIDRDNTVGFYNAVKMLSAFILLFDLSPSIQ